MQAPSLWFNSIERIQRLFEKESPGPGRLCHYLVVAPFTRNEQGQFRFNGTQYRPPGEPPREERLLEGGGTLAPFSADGPLVGWLSRFYGHADAFSRFAEIAIDAGALLEPVRLPRLLTAPDGIDSGPIERRDRGAAHLDNPAYRHGTVNRWMVLLHELAWENRPGLRLSACRQIWEGNETMPYWDDGQLSRDFDALCFEGSRGYKLRVSNTVPPQRYFSVLRTDLFAASASAIDRLLEMQTSPIDSGEGAGVAVKPGDPSHLTRGERDLWQALAGKYVPGKELAHQLRTSQDSVRRQIHRMRENGFKIENKASLGYWRPDAPPPAPH
jgi:biotin operon repressor